MFWIAYGPASGGLVHQVSRCIRLPVATERNPELGIRFHYSRRPQSASVVSRLLRIMMTALLTNAKRNLFE